MSIEQGEETMNDQTRPQKIIDLRLPLTWLIGATLSIVVSMATFYNKVDSIGSKQTDLQTSFDKLNTKLDKSNDTVSSLQNGLLIVQGKNDIQQTQIDRNSNDIQDMRRDVDDLRKGTRGVLR